MVRQYKNPEPLTFTAYIHGTDTAAQYVEFPYDLKETFGYGNLVPFKATFDGHASYQGSLAKMGGPKALILIRKDIAAQLGKSPGQQLEVRLELDDKPRELPLPHDLQAALKQAGLLEAFERLAYTQRKEYVQWITEAKKPETRQNRLAKAIEMIVAKTDSQSVRIGFKER